MCIPIFKPELKVGICSAKNHWFEKLFLNLLKFVILDLFGVCTILPTTGCSQWGKLKDNLHVGIVGST